MAVLFIQESTGKPACLEPDKQIGKLQDEVQKAGRAR